MRLFTTSNDREILERIKRITPKERAMQEEGNLPPAFALREGALANEVQVKGVVIRERAPAVIWINRSNTLGDAAKWQDLAITLSPVPGDVAFEASTEQGSVSLRPGQIWFREENRITEQYLRVQSSTAETSSLLPGVPSANGAASEAGAQVPSIGLGSVLGSGDEIKNIVDTLSPENRINQAESILRSGKVE
jgi:hypothetical protein